MKTQYGFPEDSLAEKPRTLGQIFTRAVTTYTADDLRSLRGSVHYSNMAVKNGAMHYMLSVPHAVRKEDGNFTVFISRTNIVKDRINGYLEIAHVKNDQDPKYTCTQDDVIETRHKLEDYLRCSSTVVAAYPHDSDIRLWGNIHWHTAKPLFNQPMTKDEIMRRVWDNRRELFTTYPAPAVT